MRDSLSNFFDQMLIIRQLGFEFQGRCLHQILGCPAGRASRLPGIFESTLFWRTDFWWVISDYFFFFPFELEISILFVVPVYQFSRGADEFNQHGTQWNGEGAGIHLRWALSSFDGRGLADAALGRFPPEEHPCISPPLSLSSASFCIFC